MCPAEVSAVGELSPSIPLGPPAFRAFLRVAISEGHGEPGKTARPIALDRSPPSLIAIEPNIRAVAVAVAGEDPQGSSPTRSFPCPRLWPPPVPASGSYPRALPGPLSSLQPDWRGYGARRRQQRRSGHPRARDGTKPRMARRGRATRPRGDRGRRQWQLGSREPAEWRWPSFPPRRRGGAACATIGLDREQSPVVQHPS